jgi:hypothetical protein
MISTIASARYSSAQSAEETSSPCEALRSQKAKVYGFRLAQLSETQMEEKGKEVSAFWKHVQADGPAGTACVRSMLEQEKTDHNFQFDAASILYQADHSPATLVLVRDSIAQADFQESDPASYLSLALDLGQSGVDIRVLAAKFLRYPDAVVHVPEHGLDLDSDTAALFLYGTMDPSLASNALIEQLQAPEPFVREAAAHLLAEQMTDESFRALSQWKGVSKIAEDFRRNDIQAIMRYKAPNPDDSAHPKWTREKVLSVIAGLPHTREEFDDMMAKKGVAFDQQVREKKPTPEELSTIVAESEPIYGIADRTSFIASAIATLKPEDFRTIREARRKSLFNVSDESFSEYLAFTQLMIGLLNRLDLYKDYRSH